jgi:hypothetical protein
VDLSRGVVCGVAEAGRHRLGSDVHARVAAAEVQSGTQQRDLYLRHSSSNGRFFSSLDAPVI